MWVYLHVCFGETTGLDQGRVLGVQAMNEPLPLKVPTYPGLNLGDIITFDEVFTRPKVDQLAWWMCLIFGKSRYAPIWWQRIEALLFQYGHRFIVQEGDPPHLNNPMPFQWCTRRACFGPRELQKFRITEVSESGQS